MLAGFSHETNTYCPDGTSLDEFVRWRGSRITEEAIGTATVWGGFVDRAADLGLDAVAVYTADAVPSGTIDASAWSTMRAELLESIVAAEPFDAVALNLHGAAVADGCDDVEGDLCTAVREVAGTRPVGAVFDLHGNLTQAMCDALDLVLPYHEYPHTDTRERGTELVDLLARRVADMPRPAVYLASVPMLLPVTRTTDGPGAAANEVCARVEARPGVIDCTLLHGFPYADLPFANASVVCTAIDDFTARAGAEYVAKWLWFHRDDFMTTTFGPDAAVAEARRQFAERGGPVVVHETDDNPGGGAPGDGTALLRSLIDAELPAGSACFGFVHDPETAAAAHAAGVGEYLAVRLGARSDGRHGTPIIAEAEVRALSDGRWILKALGAGARTNLREMACLRIGGVDVIVSSRRQQTFDDGCFEIHGIDIEERDIVALKSSNHFRAYYAPLATAIVTSDAGGLTSERLDAFPRVRDRRNLWPLA